MGKLTNTACLWNHEQVARYIGSAPGSVRVKCSRRQIPFLKIGRLVRFDPDEIQRWLQGKRVEVAEQR